MRIYVYLNRCIKNSGEDSESTAGFIKLKLNKLELLAEGCVIGGKTKEKLEGSEEEGRPATYTAGTAQPQRVQHVGSLPKNKNSSEGMPKWIGASVAKKAPNVF